MRCEEKRVMNCQGCPFVLNDNQYGFCGCSINDFITENLEPWEQMPDNKVHKDCPLLNVVVEVRIDSDYWDYE